MNVYRIFYTVPGATHKHTPSQIVKAATAQEAVETFNASHIWADIVAITKD